MFDQLKGMKDLASMMGNLGEMKEKAEQLQAELATKQVTGDAGAGAVKVTISGKMQVLKVEIEPAMLAAFIGEGNDSDRVMVEELIAAATNVALEKAQEMIRDHMMQMTGGMNLPGMEKLLGGM